MMIDKVWLETSNIRVYERYPVIHLTKGAGYLAWFKVAIQTCDGRIQRKVIFWYTCSKYENSVKCVE